MTNIKKLVCHGDSLTQGTDLEAQYTWPALVGSTFQLEVVNSGIGGDTSGGLLGRFYPDVVQHGPDIVLILAGTNDLWWDVSVNTILANIFAMASQARYHQIAPLIGTPLPLYMGAVAKQEFLAFLSGYQRCLDKLSRLVEALLEAAKASDIATIDYHHLFQDAGGQVLGNLYLPDGLHPNRLGHRRMATKTVEVLGSLFLRNFDK
jgi:acyl-CoA thioesterase-1